MAVFGNDTLWKRATQPEQTYKALGKRKKKNSSTQVSVTNHRVRAGPPFQHGCLLKMTSI